ncbi:MAG: hypothetical protein P4L53_05810 [Candidatus Obscuribacterales bacterium]|nr:hypothetical protein [Candidatus Obscuribacterales bacterium]
MTGATAFLDATTSGEINHELERQFLALYPNRHKSILKDASRNSDWVTISRHAPLIDSQLIDAISLKENLLRGCRWHEQTKFAVLDVDKNSQLHNELGLARLRHTLASVGLDKPLLFQSSDSGGWHIYLSLSSWANSAEVQNTLRAWLAAEGYEIRQGQLEIFPSNNGLRLPLQKGFAWLTDQAEIKIKREALTKDQAIASFLDALDASVHSWNLVRANIERRLEAAAAVATPAIEPEEDGFSSLFTSAGMISEIYDAGRAYWQNGLTKEGQRNHAILCVGHYLWYGDDAAGVRALPGLRQGMKRAEVIETWLRTKHNGYSQTVLKGDWKTILGEIGRACNWTQPEGKERPLVKYPATDRAIDRLIVLTKQTGRVWYPEDFEKGNVKREESARDKIRQALLKLVEEGRKITIKGLERLSGCRRETVRRHSDIWAALQLSKGLGDLICRGVAVLPSLESSYSIQSEPVVEIPVAKSDLVYFSRLKEPVLESPQKLFGLSPLLTAWKASPDFFMVFETLRLKIYGATANNSTAMAINDLLAATSFDFSSGVKHRRKQSLQVGEASGMACSLNGCLPTLCAGPLHLPQASFLWHFVRARLLAPGTSASNIFCMELQDANLTAIGKIRLNSS